LSAIFSARGEARPNEAMTLSFVLLSFKIGASGVDLKIASTSLYMVSISFVTLSSDLSRFDVNLFRTIIKSHSSSENI
jgi:hypothetical protein